jgi:hypothetical protein
MCDTIFRPENCMRNYWSRRGIDKKQKRQSQERQETFTEAGRKLEERL